MRPVTLYKAASWEDASKAVAASPTARPIAGGSDLLGWIKEGLQGKGVPLYDTLVDIRSIPDTDKITFDASKGLTIGALTPLHEIETHADVMKTYPLLAKAAGAVASPNIRNTGTVGGNLNQRPRCWYLRNTEFDCYKKGGNFCFSVTGKNEFHAILGGELCYIVHPSDTAPALMALGASAVIQTASGEKTVKLDDYFIGPRTDVLRENILTQGDLLKQITVPAPKAGTGMSFIKAQRRGQTYDFAVVNVATALTISNGTVSEASIVLSGVAPTPHRAVEAEAALKGQKIDATLVKNAADQALLGARPMTENAYKVGVAKNLIVRSVMEAAANANA
jgi:xanthine dehydrogenase YagS FAD-binding subunit